MTERELREKLQSAYGTMPDATRAAFEHSLTHHRVETRHPVRRAGECERLSRLPSC